MERADLEQWRPRDVARLLALVESQRRYFQEIVASIPVGLLVLSADLDVILANTAVRKVFNWPSSGAARLKVDTVLPAWVLEHVGQVLKTGVPQTNVVVEAEVGGKRRLRIGIVAIQSWDDEAAPEALVTVEDLGGLGAAGQTAYGTSGVVPVRGAGAQGVTAAELVDHLEAVVWAVELRGTSFVFVSGHAERLLGFPADFWINNPTFWLDRVHPADRERVRQWYQRAIENPEGTACEFRALAADGRVVWLRETARPVTDSEGRPVYLAGITVDVTERRLLEQQLIQSERVEALTKLASRMAHDLNDALMILTGYGEELLNGLPATSPLRGEAKEMLTAADRVSELASHLLAFARKQTGAADTIDLEPVLKAASEALGVELKGSVKPTRVKANAGQLEQALAALIEAGKKTLQPNGRIAIETSWIQIEEEQQRARAPLRRGAYAAITIAGSSVRADAGLNEARFEGFLPGKDPADDTGARLAQAYGMIRQWGGDIAVCNATAEGTIFRVFLERVAGPESPAGPRIAEAGPPDAATTLETILVVEDEAGIRALVRKFLRKHGYEVLEASNGEQALAIVEEYRGRIDLLITDMMMPQMGGRELVDRLHQQGRDMKILYISGYTDDSTVYAAELPPGSAFLQKPFTLSALLDKVRDVLTSGF